MLQSPVDLICLFILLVGSTQGRDITQDDLNKIDDFMEDVLQCTGIPGMNLAAVHEGEIVVAKGYGLANLDTQEPVTGDTIFNIASITKHMTALLNSLMFHRYPNYNWDTPVREIIGDWFHFNTGYLSNSSTTRDVLAHKMGFAAHDIPGYLDVFERNQFLERFRFMEQWPNYFRTDFWYNNNMFSVAGAVAEALGGAEWESLIQTEFLDPLGMDKTTFLFMAAPELEGFATCYEWWDNQWMAVPGEVFGGSKAQSMAGEIASTANDMAHWLNLMLGEGPRLFDYSVVEDILVPEFITNNDPLFQKPNDADTMSLSVTYARGIDNGHYRGYRSAGHGGSWYGYNSYMHLLPDVKVGVYTSANAWINNAQYMIAGYVSDILMGVEPFFTSQDACDMNFADRLKQEPRKRQNKDLSQMKTEKEFSFPLSAYVGEFGNFLYGNISISLNGGQQLQMSYGRLGSYTLYQMTDTSFWTQGNTPASDWIEIGNVDYEYDFNTGGYDRLSVSNFEYWDNPVFTRGLMLSDAPPPSLDTC